ncbi:PaaI family thioesterase [Sciscionella marina]|uniref:PaaI family thioesterase n=1 Tax=Sciscionella marina TaxID=508770 RepID=UPI0012F65B9F|nr:PaaI family thioesterase [Sciscionella marina]
MSYSVDEAVAAPYGGSEEQWLAWANGMPVSARIGLRCHRIEAGRAHFRLAESDWPLNANGAIHGGMVVGCADHCMGLVASTVLDSAHVPATGTINADFLRPALPPLTFEAVVDRSGRTLVFVAVTVYERSGKVASRVTGVMVTDGASRFAPPAVARVPGD